MSRHPRRTAFRLAVGFLLALAAASIPLHSQARAEVEKKIAALEGREEQTKDLYEDLRYLKTRLVDLLKAKGDIEKAKEAEALMQRLIAEHQESRRFLNNILEDLRVSKNPETDVLLCRIQKAENEIRDDEEFMSEVGKTAETLVKGVGFGMSGSMLLLDATMTLEKYRSAIARDRVKIAEIQGAYEKLPASEKQAPRSPKEAAAGKGEEGAARKETNPEGKSAADLLLNPYGKLSRERIDALRRSYGMKEMTEEEIEREAVLSRITSFKVNPEKDVILRRGQSRRFKVLGYSEDGAKEHDLTGRMAWRVQRQGGDWSVLLEPVFKADDFGPGTYLVRGTFGSYTREFVIRVDDIRNAD